MPTPGPLPSDSAEARGGWRIIELLGLGVAMLAALAALLLTGLTSWVLAPISARVAGLVGSLGLSALVIPVLRATRPGGAADARLRARAETAEAALADGARELERTRAERDRRTREADAFLQIAQASRSILDERELFTHITRAAAVVCGTHRCSLYLTDEWGAWVIPTMSQHADGTVDPEAWRAFKALGKLSLRAVPFLRDAVETREPVVIHDAAADPRVPRTWLEAFRLQAFFAVPLICRGRVTGVLTFSHTTRPRPIPPEQVELAVSLAEQIALAIENARLHTDTEARRREAEVIADLAAAVNASLDLDTVLRRVTEAARELCQSEVAAIALRDPESGAMRPRYHVPASAAAPAATPAPPWPAVVPAPISPERPGPADDDPLGLPVSDSYARVILQEGVVTAMVVPVRSERGDEGLLYVGNHAPRPFSPRDKAILRRLADHAAIAIRNSQLYEEVQLRLGRMTRLTELGRLISSSLEYQQALDFVTGAALELLGGDMVRLWAVEEEARELRLAASAERGTRRPGDAPVAPFPLGHGLVGHVVERRVKHYSPSLLEDPLQDDKAWVRAHGYTSQIVVPLVVNDRALGALAVLTRLPRRFRPDEEELLELFAAQAATALENARLYQAAQEAYRQLTETQHQLVQARKMEAVGRLAGGVAHDFNNLLTVIRGRCELVLDALPPEDRVARHVGLIDQTADRAVALTRQLLAFSKKQILQPTVLNPNAVVTEMERMLRHLIGEDVRLKTTLDPALPNVLADASQIEQVILNLVVNARDAMPHGGRLHVETAAVELAEDAGRQVGAPAGRYACLLVRDTGVGMTEEVRARIFEPFFTTKEPGKGTGLGLATVYGVVQQSGGAIDVDSRPGHGTTFRVLLPAVDRPVAPQAPPIPRQESARGDEAILLVEDEADVRALARDVLVGAGYAVLEAEKPSNALTIVEHHAGPIALLLTDVVMPQMSGRALADCVAPARPGMRVLFMSGYTDEAISHHGVLEPGVAFLAKPFTAAALLGKVREVLDAAGGAGAAG